MAAKPHSARHVESLQFLWLPSGDNSDLLIEIVRDCVNLKNLLIHRRGNGDETNPLQITKKHATDLATLLAACPCLTSFIYKTLVGWAGPGQLEGDEGVVNGAVRVQSFTKNLKDARFVSVARKLSELALYEQSEWIARALLPHVSAKLERLDLGQDVNLLFDKNILRNLSRQCPSLQTLDVRCSVRLVDLIQACKAWGSSLRVLRIARVEDEEGESAQLPPSWPKMETLEELSLGPDFFTPLDVLNEIGRASTLPRLNTLVLTDLEDPLAAIDVDMAQAELDNALCSLIGSDRTEFIDMNSGRVRVGRRVLHNLKQARYLACLYVSPHSSVKSSDIDNLFEAYPDLGVITAGLQNISLRQKEWQSRMDSIDTENEKKLWRDHSVWGLGL